MPPTPAELTRRLAAELAVEPAPLLAIAIDWLATRVPEYIAKLGAHEEDPELTTSTLLDILVAALQSDSELSLYEFWDTAREIGRRRCDQGIDMETLLRVMAVHRDAVVEVFDTLARRIKGSEEVVLYAHRRLDVLLEKLTVSVTLGYVDALDERYQAQQAALQALISIARSVNRSLELSDVGQAGLAETVKALNLDAGVLWLSVGYGGELMLGHTFGLSEHEAKLVEGSKPRRTALIARALRSSAPVQAAVQPGGPLENFAGALALGLRTGEGELVAVMTLASRRPRIFSDSELAFTNAVGDQLVVALDHARQHRREARTDFLTGLANRQEFERAVEREVAAANRSGRPLTLALVDLDNLKVINDTLGHHAGDLAIRAVADALRRSVRASDVCARLGGDEFAIALPELSVEQAEEVATRVKQALRKANSSGELAIAVTVSFGFAPWKRGSDWAAIFKLADRALYREKRRRMARAKDDSLRERSATAPALPPA